MKFIKAIQKRLTVVMVSVLTMTYGYSLASSNVVHLKNIGQSFLKIEQETTQFFNPNSDAPYNECCIKIRNILTDFHSKIENITRSGKTDTFTMLIDNLGREVHKHFNALYGIINQYNGKPDQTTKFVGDIKRVFNSEVIFSSIQTKLTALHEAALAANDNDAAQVIEQLIGVLAKKNAEWNKKSSFTLLSGLTTRMNLNPAQ